MKSPAFIFILFQISLHLITPSFAATSQSTLAADMARDTSGNKAAQESFTVKDTYIALGFFGTTILLGNLDSKGDFKSFVCPQKESDSSGFTCEPFKKVKQQAKSAAGKPWYSLQGEVTDGSFAAAKLGPNKKWVEKIGKTMEKLTYFVEGEDSPVHWYEFGKGDSNHIYATQPIVSAMRKVDWKESKSVLSIPEQLFPNDSTPIFPELDTRMELIYSSIFY